MNPSNHSNRYVTAQCSLGLLVALAATPAAAEIFTVTNTDRDGAGSLSQAIVDANTSPGFDEIHFAIPGSGVQRIQPVNLAAIEDSVLIDGYTQPGSSPNTLFAPGSDAVPLIELNGDADLAGNGLIVDAADVVLRGLIINGFLGSGNSGNGVYLTSQADDGGVRIIGCFLGTDASGTLAVPNENFGIRGTGGIGLEIGGLERADRNIISGNLGGGISLNKFGETIQNTVIGLDAVGGLLGNGGHGVVMDGGNDALTLIGGVEPGATNFIAGNAGSGIAVIGSAGRKAFARNSIFDNGELGIDLGGDGVTPNDDGDFDGPPNAQMNFPEILSIERVDDDSIHVAGQLRTIPTPGLEFTLSFYQNIQCDPSGHGEGKRRVQNFDVTTDDDGVATFDETLDAAFAQFGDFITATATDDDGNTSEFSACAAPDPIFSDGFDP